MTDGRALSSAPPGANVVFGVRGQGLDERTAGGKAAGLARLLAVGATVPPFFVVPASAFRAHLADPAALAELGAMSMLLADMRSERGSDPVALEAQAARLVAATLAAPLDGALRAAIADALPEIGPGPYAVRSSMVGEDSAAHSFAGQLSTELYLPGADEVVDGVLRCWCSAFSPPALAYAAHAGIGPADVYVAVVIQAMVDAEVAGVAFSANPLTGERDQCLITAVYGLGEGAVGDTAPADEYVWSPDRGELSASIADKDVRVVAARSGRGTELAAVPAADRRLRALNHADVGTVGALARELAASSGAPVDLEWCSAGGTLYALQARPITALPPAPVAATGTARVYDNANIQESFNGVTTPLTFSFASRVYAGVYGELVRRLGASARTRAELAAVSRNLLALIDGRVYNNLGSWGALIEALPGGRRRVEEFETIMLRTTIGTSDPRDRSLTDRARRAAELALMGGRVAAVLARQDAEVEGYIARFERFYDGVDRAGLSEISLDELAGKLHAFLGEAVAPGATSYLNDVRLAMACGRLRRLLEHVHGPDSADARLADLLGGIEGLESTEPTRRLISIARAIAADARLAALLADRPDDVVALIRAHAPKLARDIDAYIDRYGDRTIGELKLESDSLRDDPRFLGEVLLNYLRRPELDADAALYAERARADAALADLSARLPSWRRAVLEREVALARRAVECRERLRLRRTWAFGLARDIYRAIGLRLHEAGALEHPRDVLYLSVDEVDAFIDGRSVCTSLGALASNRKAEFAEYAARRAPDRIETVGSPYLDARGSLPSSAEPAGEGTLHGLGCCAGTIEAPVHVILDPRQSMSVDGEILCAVRTDPGWAPLFPTAGGLIVERGSTLSHSAVVAREFGIPTVVGVPDVTRILRSGDRVRLDGGRGLIERLDPCSSNGAGA